jgi:hypothetical protein
MVAADDDVRQPRREALGLKCRIVCGRRLRPGSMRALKLALRS